MEKYTFDEKSLMKDGRRWFPIMGEIHYSRVPHQFWADELCKMKAGGVGVVSAYVIWIHHEEIEGQYDFSGDRNLHDFVKTVGQCGLKLLLRIGPWCHGEVRNGGFPDWLLHKDFEPRTNNEKYFAAAEKWYKKIYEQVSEFVGNTIMGVQIENEYGHCGGLYEKESGEAHMKRLQKLAIDAGFKVSLYTATGWGGAWTGGMVPVMGGYCDAPWDQRLTEIEPSGNYTFTHERNDHNIGSDHGFGYGITFDIEKFPYLTAELGGGLQVTSHRRTIATAKDIAAVATVKLGSGVNLLGFYMYHGGTNPEGKLTTLQESRATGYLNDLPVKSYDFRAPVREFGQVSETLRELKLLSYFAKDFGEEICSFKAEIPAENPLDPKDLKKLRYSFRCADDGSKGYLFVNNYVRHQVLSEHKNVELKSPDGKTAFPDLNVKNGDFFFEPFNMTYGQAKIKTATVTPLLKNENLYVFYKREADSSKKSFFDFEVQPVAEKFLVLSRKNALNTWNVKGRLFVTESDSYVYENEKNEAVITGRGKKALKFSVYPDFEKAPAGFKKTGTVNLNEAEDLPAVEAGCYEKENCCGAGEAVKINSTYSLDLSSLLGEIGSNDVSDVFVKINYTGESAELYAEIDGKKKLLLDNFWLGEDFPWEIGLKRFKEKGVDLSKLELKINPLKKDAKLYLEKWPEIKGDAACELKLISAEKEIKTIIRQ